MKRPKISILERKWLYCGYIALEEARISISRDPSELPDISHRTAIVRDDAVAAVVYAPSLGELVLVRQYRYPISRHQEDWLTEIPAGMVDNGESPEQTLRRELYEETGYQAENVYFIQCFYVSPGISSERLHLFYVEVDPSHRIHQGGGRAEEQENIEVIHVPKNEVRKWLQEGKILDAKSLIGLQWFFLEKVLD